MTYASIAKAIEEATGSAPTGGPTSIGGGCINEAFRLDDYFVKTNRTDRVDMFEAEADGLRFIAKQNKIRTPEVVCVGATQRESFLVLEHLPLQRLDSGSEEVLGHQLASFHTTTANFWGWTRDNYIGSSPQENNPKQHRNWPDFFRARRLEPMFRQLHDRGMGFRHATALLDLTPEFFPNGLPSPSLLHGDLWAGNAAALPDGSPVIFDPAIYYGDREADLAMTRLFGGFSSRFYSAYEEAWPLGPEARTRIDLYNLYHILNHALLFGDSYARQAQEMIDSLIARP